MRKSSAGCRRRGERTFGFRDVLFGGDEVAVSRIEPAGHVVGAHTAESGFRNAIEAVVHDDAGLFGADGVYQPGGSPSVVSLESRAAVVPPHDVHRAVFGNELADLAVEEIDVARVIARGDGEFFRVLGIRLGFGTGGNHTAGDASR
jgi:hypothetical protein